MKNVTVRWACLMVVCAVAGSVTGCAAQQKAVRFRTTDSGGGGSDPIDAIVRAMAAGGQTPTFVDRATGIVQTDWQDTGFGYGFVNKEGATIHRRYTAVVTPGAGGSDVLLRMDVKRCAPPRATTVTTTQTSSNPSGPSVSFNRRGVSLSPGSEGGTTTVSQIQTEMPCEPMDGLIEQHQKELDALGEELVTALRASRT